MSDRTKQPPTEMEARARRLAQLLVDAANDPDGDARREAAELEREIEQELILDAYHAARRPAEPVTGAPLGNLDALRDYLRAAGSEVFAHDRGLRIGGSPPIDVDWAAEHRQVRFTFTPVVSAAAGHRTEIAELVARGNAATGIAVWRAEPELIAEVTARVAGDGSVSSAEVDRAIKILRTTVARDAAALRRATGG